MCKAMEEMRAEERKEATYAKAIAVAQKMLKAGIPYEEIADMVELPLMSQGTGYEEACLTMNQDYEQNI